jgi:hypothetical protein
LQPVFLRLLYVITNSSREVTEQLAARAATAAASRLGSDAQLIGPMRPEDVVDVVPYLRPEPERVERGRAFSPGTQTVPAGGHAKRYRAATSSAVISPAFQKEKRSSTIRSGERAQRH